MRVRERISSFMLLMLIVISSCSVLHSLAFACDDASHHMPHHTCCHCEVHETECATHTHTVDHRCATKGVDHLNYITGSSFSYSKHFALSYIKAFCDLSKLNISLDFIYTRLFRCRGDDLKEDVVISLRQLRAPPAFI